MMAARLHVTTAGAFALFALLDLGCLEWIAAVAIRDARYSDPANLLPVFAALKAAAVCGLLLLTVCLGGSFLRRSTRRTNHVEV
jgi:hypothetical protein